YYRLSALTLRIPPLRDRKEDIPLLVDHFLKKEDRQVSISPEVMKILVEYAWPGNVRELENEIKKLALLCDTSGAHPCHRQRPRGQPRPAGRDIPAVFQHQE
ncbi:MAG: two-component system response regulator, partial [Thermodesulfobacteriota bacterium]|nr:two-component system response regulator [Thermodesulfobacteriota bacterium]